MKILMKSCDWQSKLIQIVGIACVFFILAFPVKNGRASASLQKYTSLSTPTDLTKDGEQAVLNGRPIVLLFTLPGCSFCEVVRKNYLIPMQRDSREELRPIIREVIITDKRKFIGFNKELISHGELAKKYGVRTAPTVVMVDSAGKLLTQPIVGGDIAGLYGGYLDNAITEARSKLTEQRH